MRVTLRNESASASEERDREYHFTSNSRDQAAALEAKIRFLMPKNIG